MTAVRDGAIVGFGNVAANGHVPGWRACDRFRIVAVTDPDPRRRLLAQELLPAARVYPDIASLLAAERLDFVDIAAPPAMHTAAIVAAAAGGAHVLCEKPLATSLADYAPAADAVDSAGVVLFPVHNWRHAEAYRLVRAILADGRLGALRRIEIETERDGCSVTTAENWRLQAGIGGGGILVDHGWHAFYLLLGLAGESPAHIAARLERRRFVDADVEDTATCTVGFPSLTAEVRLTWAATGRSTRWRLLGSRGELLVDDARVDLDTDGGRETRMLGTALSAGSHHPDWFAGVVAEFERELDDPAARGRGRKEAELCLTMLHLAYASSRSGGVVLALPRQLPVKDGRVDAPRTAAHGG
ncbi:Gfo/Idh/MocA family oxidoreductase [Candidatus Binatia bacterium]|nr:Gfo/Idh/MocA family oxidoreductase [Candidatus Binatia bacterium]